MTQSFWITSHSHHQQTERTQKKACNYSGHGVETDTVPSPWLCHRRRSISLLFHCCQLNTQLCPLHPSIHPSMETSICFFNHVTNRWRRGTSVQLPFSMCQHFINFSKREIYLIEFGTFDLLQPLFPSSDTRLCYSKHLSFQNFIQQTKNHIQSLTK